MGQIGQTEQVASDRVLRCWPEFCNMPGHSPWQMVWDSKNTCSFTNRAYLFIPNTWLCKSLPSFPAELFKFVRVAGGLVGGWNVSRFGACPWRLVRRWLISKRSRRSDAQLTRECIFTWLRSQPKTRLTLVKVDYVSSENATARKARCGTAHFPNRNVLSLTADLLLVS